MSKTITFRNDVTSFTTAFSLATVVDDDTRTVDTYHLLDTYAPVNVALVAAFIAARPDTKLSAIASAIKHDVKHAGIVDTFSGLDPDAVSAENLADARKLKIWASKFPGCVNAVCVPFTLREFANAYSDAETPPATKSGLLAAARESLIAGGWDRLHDIDPNADAVSAVSKIAPELIADTVPSDADADAVSDAVSDADTTSPDTVDTRTRKQLIAALRKHDTDFKPAKSLKIGDLRTLAASAGV